MNGGAILTGSISPLGTQGHYLYVAVLSVFKGRLLLSRHKNRQSWETQGGHIEPGETPLAAAKRELYEECGAVRYRLVPVCDYSAAGTHGVFFVAFIEELGPLPNSEMAEARPFAHLPDNLTYPGITPVLYRRAQALINEKKGG